MSERVIDMTHRLAIIIPAYKATFLPAALDSISRTDLQGTQTTTSSERLQCIYGLIGCGRMFLSASVFMLKNSEI